MIAIVIWRDLRKEMNTTVLYVILLPIGSQLNRSKNFFINIKYNLKFDIIFDYYSCNASLCIKFQKGDDGNNRSHHPVQGY